jgi:hypothetical protein
MLANDQAVHIDCEDILAQSGGGLTGFLVLHAPRELDVVVVYTTPASANAVATFHAERVPARVVRVPFVLPDNENSPH